MTDQQVSDHLKLLKKANVTLHVRGDDRKPVVEFKCKFSRKVVGGIELKRRLQS